MEKMYYFMLFGIYVYELLIQFIYYIIVMETCSFISIINCIAKIIYPGFVRFIF